MRGKEAERSRKAAENGITPAYAGKSLVRIEFAMCFRDHPRLCGEKENAPNDEVKAAGSPPPMRGKGQNQMQKQPHCGITPAYAGKSLSFFSFLSFFKDHPRLCGEKKSLRQSRWRSVGSPPPMRGKASLSAAAS